MANANSWAASVESRTKAAQEKFWAQMAKTHQKFSFSRFEYLGATTKSVVVCPEHGEFLSSPTYLLAGSGCKQCANELIGGMKRKSLSQWKAEAMARHASKYDYSLCTSYKTNKDMVVVVCPTHGQFTVKALKHLQGQGCGQCANDGKRERNRAIADATGPNTAAKILEATGGKWAMDVDTYKSSHQNVYIKCLEHGGFLAKPYNALNGSGCVRCGEIKHRVSMDARKLTTEEWVRRATKVHAGKYSYEKSVYLGDKTKTTVTCPTHGDFQARTDGHIYEASGCPRCSHHESKAERAIASWLSAFTRVEPRTRSVVPPKELDIYLPDNNLAIEYSGMFWHSHFDAEDEVKNKHKHFDKYRACAAKGIRLITIYESEWQERPKVIRRLLRNAIGRGHGKLMARKCELKQVSHAEAIAFFEKYHPQGGAGVGESYGLYWGGKLVACMRFAYGINDRNTNPDLTWTLSRYATRVNVVGGAGRLFKAFLNDKNPSKVKSFSDNRYFSGAMYEKLGFVLEEESAPDYQVWSPRTGLRSKSAYQRRHLQARLAENNFVDTFDVDTDPRSERDVTYQMGCGRIYDCGKKKWVWRKS